jgi:hypothetical protein
MDPASEKAHRSFGLLACGSSGVWSVDIDESSDREGEWFLDIEGPRVYLNFPVRDLGIVPQVIAFLQLPPAARSTPNGSLTVGTFRDGPVTLVWDDEDFPRCFVVIGTGANGTVRLSLHEEDIKMLLEAFRRAGEDLPDKADGRP